jgi:hypothetical protein
MWRTLKTEGNPPVTVNSLGGAPRSSPTPRDEA